MIFILNATKLLILFLLFYYSVMLIMCASILTTCTNYLQIGFVWAVVLAVALYV